VTPEHIVASLDRLEKGIGDVLLDWLTEREMPWPKVKQNHEGPVLCTACKWCFSLIDFPPNVSSNYRDWTCCCCTPAPSPRLIVKGLLSMMDLSMHADVTKLAGDSIEVLLARDPYSMLEIVLSFIDQSKS